MNFTKFSKNHLGIILVVMLYNHIAAGDDGSNGYHGDERDALKSLKDQLNSSSLHSNWTGLMCYMNTTHWNGIQCVNGRVTGIELENMGFTGTIKPDTFFNLTELSIFRFKNNSISGNLLDFSNNQKMTEIDLSGNNFDGQIPNSLLNLIHLESLQLQYNKLTGRIPPLNQSSLRVFNVSDNNLSGAIPNTTILQSFDYSSYAGNKNLCGSPSAITCPNTVNDSTSNSDHSKNSSSLGAILVFLNVVVLVILLLLAIIYFKKYKNLKKKVKSTKLLEIIEEKGDMNTKEAKGKRLSGAEESGKLMFIDRNEARFELDDLLKSSAEGIGKGNFGNCYKAMLVNGPTVVVKRLRDLKPLSKDDFVKQVMAIGDHKHPNLLPLLAFYYSTEEKLLVHKFASNGNLYNTIHGGRGTKDRIPFRWSSRLAVARSVGRAIEHLHLNNKSPTIVPHGNLKSSNVLFNENDVVQVSDYGLTSLIALPIAAQNLVSFQSPEYKTSKRVSRKSDIWSYGCLLLEILTGKGVNGVDLCNWVHRAVREEWTAEIFDMEIAVQRSANYGMVTLMQIAMRCCETSPENRPEMSEVIREIENIKTVVSSEDEEDPSLDLSTDDSLSATP